MSNQARIYIGCVVTLGALALGGATAQLQVGDPRQFLTLLLLAIFSAGLKVRVPGMCGTISLSFLPILLSTALVSLAETIWIAAVPTLIQTVFRAKRRPKLVQTAFNVAAVVLSAVTASLAFTTITQWWGRETSSVAMAAAAGLYYAVNALLVSAVVCLAEQKPLSGVWSSCYLWTLPYFSLGSLILLLASETASNVHWQPSLAALPVMLLAYHYFALYTANRGQAQATT
jgi:hypothetical protein